MERRARRSIFFCCSIAVGLIADLSFSGLAHPLAAQSLEEPAPQQPNLILRVDASHAALPVGATQFYLRIRVTSAAKANNGSRAPLNLSVIFDRSDSMRAETKIGYARLMGHGIVDNLTGDDLATFVAVGDGLHVLAPRHRVVNREYLHRRIDELYAENHGDLRVAIENSAESGASHVILLTDGLADEDTKSESWEPLVKRLRQSGMTLSTFGFGTDCNKRLLAQLAQVGGGRFVHVKDPTEIRDYLRKEMNALLPVVAEQVTLGIRLPSGTRALQVYGVDGPIQSLEDISLGELTSDRERVLLLKLRNEPVDEGVENDLSVRLAFDDMAIGHRVEMQQMVSIERPIIATATALKPTFVLSYAQLVQALDGITAAIQSRNANLAAEMLELHQRRFTSWKQVAKDRQDQDFMNKAFIFDHYVRELQDLLDRGAIDPNQNLNRTQ